MLGQIPKSSLGRQIATRSFVHESWHRPAHRALVKAVVSQPFLCRYPGPSVTFKGTYTRNIYRHQLVKQQARDQQIVAMHAASSGTNGASTSQATEGPAQPATTLAGMQQGGGAVLAADSGLDPAYSSPAADAFSIAIVGDLHLEQKGMQNFHRARQQLKGVLEGKDGGEPRVVQLGDLGGYNEKPGSMYCFRVADAYLNGFSPIRSALVTGNHDLEGEDFETDEANLAAWTKVFKQRHYWSMELGNVVCLGISTVRFRSNAFSAHEVYIDEEQMRWFKQALREAAGRPVIVFSHAPPQGCGLTVIPSVHVKNRCAFLNHSSNSGEFMRLVEANPNIALWFSGHFHLSHNYMRSISVAGNCAFVQTGVIGDCNRDGFRHSRVLKGDKEGYKLYTMDHSTGSLRLDLEHKWQSSQPPQAVLPPSDQMCDDEDEEAWPLSSISENGPSTSGRSHTNGSSKDDEHFGFEQRPRHHQRWIPIGQQRILSIEEGMLVEYDVPSRAPIGAVFLSVGEWDRVVLLDSSGAPITVTGPNDPAGAAAVAVERQDRQGKTQQRAERNAEGGFFQIFQQNKWRLRKQKEAAAAGRGKELSLF